MPNAELGNGAFAVAIWAVSETHLARHTNRRYRISMFLTPIKTGPIPLRLSGMKARAENERQTEKNQMPPTRAVLLIMGKLAAQFCQ